ncbi:MAG: hypothetical protein M3340_04470 [Actinomycetota bacterium]|nr:hypothetical protein [Actinomycetota bacterium]
MTDFSPERVSELLDRAEGATSAHERGVALEEALAHVLGSIPGVKVVAQRALDVHGSEEIDVGISNSQALDGLGTMFEPFMFGECKSWKVPVDADRLRGFADKLRTRGQRIGILLTRKGITGDPEHLTAAQNVLSSHLAENREILVITAADLRHLQSADDVVDLLLRRRTTLIMTRGAGDADWYDNSSDQPPHGPAEGMVSMERGWEALQRALEQERRRVADMFIRRAPTLPDDEKTIVQLVVDATNALHESIENATQNSSVETWSRVLGHVVALGGITVALLRNHPEVRDAAILGRGAEYHAPNLRHTGPGTRLFSDLLTYYTGEALYGADMPLTQARLSLIGLLIESYWRLDESIGELAREEEEPS